MIETQGPTKNLFIWVAALFALLAGLIGIGTLSFAAFQQAVGDDDERLAAGEMYARSNAVILAAEDVFDALQNAERGERGYVLVQNPVFLDPYSRNVRLVEPRIDQLEQLIVESGGDGSSVEALRALSTLKLEEMAEIIARVDAGDVEGARTAIGTGYGRRLMDQIREIVSEFRISEERNLTMRREAISAAESETSQSIEQLAILGIALLIAAMIAVIAFGALLTRAYRSAAREQLIEDENEALEAAVAERTRELSIANERLIAEAHSRETAEDRLRQAQRMEAVGQLTGGIAHDFNNMLSVVIGSLDLLRRRTKDEPKLQRLIDNALQGADRAATLTARLLAFSRQQSLKPAETDLNDLLEGLTDFLQRTLGEAVRIRMKLADDTPDVFVDSAELENVIINLGANARDAMPKGGTLTIGTRRVELAAAEDRGGQPLPAGNYAEIAIEDSGEGMPPDVLAKVYEPFFTTKPVGRGTGLGLSQVHGFVLQSGGAIDIQSEVGKGTTIRLLLPQADAPSGEARPQLSEAEELPVARAGETILVVEDQDQLRSLTVDVLRDLGYTVHAAGSGKSALEMLGQSGSLSLLFTDIVMPEQTGEELARAARQIEPELKILYTSGFTQAAGVEASQLDPPGDLLRKPYTVDQLAAAIRSAIDS